MSSCVPKPVRLPRCPQVELVLKHVTFHLGFSDSFIPLAMSLSPSRLHRRRSGPLASEPCPSPPGLFSAARPMLTAEILNISLLCLEISGWVNFHTFSFGKLIHVLVTSFLHRHPATLVHTASKYRVSFEAEEDQVLVDTPHTEPSLDPPKAEEVTSSSIVSDLLCRFLSSTEKR